MPPIADWPATTWKERVVHYMTWCFGGACFCILLISIMALVVIQITKKDNTKEAGPDVMIKELIDYMDNPKDTSKFEAAWQSIDRTDVSEKDIMRMMLMLARQQNEK
jgi:tRNA uridine 5-carbamoylmethylation protein Kti12